jgi:hypothetical protein
MVTFWLTIVIAINGVTVKTDHFLQPDLFTCMNVVAQTHAAHPEFVENDKHGGVDISLSCRVTTNAEEPA